jgi:hypothetical protein
MALSAATVWEIRTAGNAANGGGFVASTGVDYTLSDTPFATYTDLVIGASNSLTSVARAFIANDVGNLINITSGAGFTTGRYEILSVAGGAATLDRSPGTLASTGGNARLGGAMTMTDANLEIIVAGNYIWLKDDGTHAPGAISIGTAAGTTTLPITMEGYNTTRGDCLSGSTIVEANRPLISNGASAVTFGTAWNLRYIEYTGSVAGGMRTGAGGHLLGCKGVNTSSGNGLGFLFSSGSTGRLTSCEASSVSGPAIAISGPASSLRVNDCYLHDSPTGVKLNGSNSVIEACIFDTCTKGLDVDAGTMHTVSHNDFYNCTDGLYSSVSSTNNLVSSNLFHSCTTGINWTVGHFGSNSFVGNNFWNNTADVANAQDIGIAPTYIDPGFTDAPNGNFAVTSALQGNLFPTEFPGDLTTNYAVAGAVQIAAGGGGAINPFNGVIVSH